MDKNISNKENKCILLNKNMNYKIILVRIAKSVNNIIGWHTNRKIVVIESDDWGSIRMPSKVVFDEFLNRGYPIDKRVHEKFDILANSQDLESLFATLKSIKNLKGQCPIITANTVVANPDFKKIKDNDFQEYFYEPFTTTLKSYYPNENVFSFWELGIREKIFFPQFHAREHYNIIKWMKLLQNNSVNDIEAFEFNMVGIPSKENPELGNQLQIAYSIDSVKDLELQKKIILEGLNLFKNLFGFTSKSFIAPVYTWNENLEATLFSKGVKYIQGNRIQNSPNIKTGKIKKIKHFLGKENIYKQIYLVRNVFFEPCTNMKKDWVNDCFWDVRTAFFCKKPVVISTHRVNYVGGLCLKNRERGNILLREFLLKIVEKYPDVEFMTSVQLGDLIKKSKK